MTNPLKAFLFVTLVVMPIILGRCLAETRPQNLVLATTKWCPYTCANEELEFGVIGRYIKAVLAQQNITLTVEYYPWSRAVHLAENNQIDGLLTAAKGEASGLLFTDTAVSHYQMCFYTKAINQWQYKEPISLNNNVLTVIQGYRYGEPLDAFIEDNEDIVRISGQSTVKRLFELLNKDRANIVVEDETVINWLASDGVIDLSLYKQAGCLGKNLFYIALVPNKANQEIIEQLNVSLKAPENLKLLQQLFLQVTALPK